MVFAGLFHYYNFVVAIKSITCVLLPIVSDEVVVVFRVILVLEINASFVIHHEYCSACDGTVPFPHFNRRCNILNTHKGGFHEDLHRRHVCQCYLCNINSFPVLFGIDITFTVRRHHSFVSIIDQVSILCYIKEPFNNVPCGVASWSLWSSSTCCPCGPIGP